MNTQVIQAGVCIIPGILIGIIIIGSGLTAADIADESNRALIGGTAGAIIGAISGFCYKSDLDTEAE